MAGINAVIQITLSLILSFSVSRCVDRAISQGRWASRPADSRTDTHRRNVVKVTTMVEVIKKDVKCSTPSFFRQIIRRAAPVDRPVFPTYVSTALMK
jgi:hypothetical protein